MQPFEPSELPESILSTLIAADGRTLAVQDWMQHSAVRGVVVLVHGLGEHSGRYEALAGQLNSWGFAVRGYDQHGHGLSHGVRGSLPSETTLIDDLADVIDDARSHMAAELPLILLGHSMGGLVAAQFVRLGIRPVDALVLSSPALDAGLGLFQKLLLKVLPNLAPNFRVGNGLNPYLISHDPKVVEAYLADRLVHDRISARMGAFIANGGAQVIAAAPAWQVPTLLLYAGSDHLVNPQGSQRFAAAAPQSVVTAVRFDDLYHELFNELEPTEVLATLRQWLDARY